MGRGVQNSVRGDGLHHSLQRNEGRPVAVQHGERLAVMGTNTDLQHDLAGFVTAHNPADFEPFHLADQHAPFAERIGSRGRNLATQSQLLRLHHRHRCDRLWGCGYERAVMHLPYPDIPNERFCPPSHDWRVRTLHQHV